MLLTGEGEVEARGGGELQAGQGAAGSATRQGQSHDSKAAEVWPLAYSNLVTVLVANIVTFDHWSKSCPVSCLLSWIFCHLPCRLWSRGPWFKHLPVYHELVPACWCFALQVLVACCCTFC